MTPLTVIADSTVWVDLLNDRQTQQVTWLEHHHTSWNIRATDLSLCEVLQGVRSEAAFRSAQNLFSYFGVHEIGGVGIATRAASNYRLLRSKGITIRKTIDCLIATYCVEHDLYLLHNDRDFGPFERFLGLKVIHPEEQP